VAAESNNRISVSEDRLRLLFAEFKLDLVKELGAYATVAALERWQAEVRDALTSLGDRVRKVEDAQTGSSAVSKYQRWALGLAAVITSSAIGELIYLALHIGGKG
jgi:hypothetical protein